MTYLLDTHIMLWAITATRKLSKAAKNVITDPKNTIIVSAISFWEISLKSSLGKMSIAGYSPEDFPEACLQVGFDIAPLSAIDCSTYHKLKPTYHKDPFDRMLIWQAIQNNYTLISADKEVRKYSAAGLNIFNS